MSTRHPCFGADYQALRDDLPERKGPVRGEEHTQAFEDLVDHAITQRLTLGRRQPTCLLTQPLPCRAQGLYTGYDSLINLNHPSSRYRDAALVPPHGAPMELVHVTDHVSRGRERCQGTASQRDGNRKHPSFRFRQNGVLYSAKKTINKDIPAKIRARPSSKAYKTCSTNRWRYIMLACVSGLSEKEFYSFPFFRPSITLASVIGAGCWSSGALLTSERQRSKISVCMISGRLLLLPMVIILSDAPMS